MSAEDLAEALDLPEVRGNSERAGRMLSPDEDGRVLVAALSGPRVRRERDAAMLALMRAGGPRRGEVARLLLSDIIGAGVVRVMGKGSKVRTVHLGPNAWALLAAWIAVRGSWPGALFCPVQWHGGLIRRPMTLSEINSVISAIGTRAGIPRFSPHDLRRSFASTLFDQNVDQKTIADMLGHSNTTTTGLYDRRGEERKMRAAALVDVPAVR